MRRTLVPGLSILALVGLLGARAVARPTIRANERGAKARVTVKPADGHPGTLLRLSFRAPDRTGVVGGEMRYYAVSGSDTAGGGSCTSQPAQDVYSAHAHTRVRVTLKPGRDGWCLGTFKGTVTEQERPVCPYREVCPMYIVLVRTIGKFKFTIQAQPPGGLGVSGLTAAGRAGLASAAHGRHPSGRQSPHRLRRCHGR